MDENFASAKSMIHFDRWDPMPELPEPKERKAGKHMTTSGSKNVFWRKYAVVIIGAALFTLYTIGLSAYVNWKAEVRVREELEADYQQKLADYQYQQQEEKQAQYFLTGQASRDAFINQEIDAVAPVISKLSTDAQKYTEASCMLARVMNASYPNSFQEVAKQAKQWMFYDGTDNSYSPHDREIAEKIVRPYLEDGIIPNGLTADMVYGSWSVNDFVLRDDFEGSGTMNTWRYKE